MTVEAPQKLPLKTNGTNTARVFATAQGFYPNMAAVRACSVETNCYC